MDLQARKLKAIEYVVGIEDENILHEIELTILKRQKQPKADKALKPFTQKQLIARAKQSTTDYLAGKVKTQEQDEKESENW
jgi:hypothetical protein